MHKIMILWRTAQLALTSILSMTINFIENQDETEHPWGLSIGLLNGLIHVQGTKHS